ncbi:UDP-phosphate galactose phosphotransferase [Streptomyces clavuligerus]|uniref:Undecaprenyl-phosphate galactose phosphotransferase n=2 Tax=Streptomyces clavuligerus TaxID=1901 RepID=E2PUG0_STRCL|nr:UDP-phosphate galactose phosphotransferase [Streptomyces clavuligerus]EFG07739.1 Undecaprenyl-phosphate galactose phosphotransferase [Streptomyces clavuligerus]
MHRSDDRQRRRRSRAADERMADKRRGTGDRGRREHRSRGRGGGRGCVSAPAKRAVDLLGAALLLLLLSPALLTAAAAVAAGSRGPVLVPRVRAGLAGRPFAMLAFRTDPATRSGRFLRRHRLDHLPELANVVRGEMSLVGPYPIPLERAWSATGPERARTAVRPGMTGPWQIGGRSELPWEEMAVLDLHYLEEHWLGLDLAILARTVPVALRGRPAGGR